MAQSPHIGGYIGLDMESIPTVENSVFNVWVENNSFACFNNARSALCSLLKGAGIRDVHVPAYTCDVVGAIADGKNIKAHYYNVDEKLDADLNFAKNLDSSSAVIVNAYFGRPVSQKTQADIKNSKALCIVDNSQAFDKTCMSSCPAVYSPRKLLGVSDGGVLVLPGVDEALIARCQPDPATQPPSLHDYTLARLEDPLRTSDQYAMYSAMETGMAVSATPMSVLTRLMLKRIPHEPIRQKRRENWKILFRHLEKYCLWQDADPQWTPAGFPIITNRQQQLRKYLQDGGIYCAIHWPHLPAPKDNRFMGEYDLLQKILTLPCDHRYCDEDMLYIANRVKDFLK